MVTIKLPYKSESIHSIEEYQKLYSSVLRSVYNKKNDGMSDKEVRVYMKSISYKDRLNSWFIESALCEVKNLSNKNNVIFGGKGQFIKRCKGIIGKEEYKKNRILPFYSVGQANEHGNRMFQINIINNNQIIFKPNRKTKIILCLPNLKQNIKKQLFQLEELSKTNSISYSVRLSQTHVFISFHEFKNESANANLKERFLSIDLNPNHIGLSISENKDNQYNILFTKHFDLSFLINNSDINKIKHETIELCKNIVNLSLHFKCKFVFLEDLNINTINHNKGNHYNKLVNNYWFRNLAINNIKKRCIINNINCFFVNPVYSSYIGNLQYNYSDPINASIEIGRRGYELCVLNNKHNFFPKVKIKEDLLHQWKETDISLFNDWKGLCGYIKNSKLRYRVQMDDVSKHHIVYRQKYNNPRGLFAYIYANN